MRCLRSWLSSCIYVVAVCALARSTSAQCEPNWLPTHPNQMLLGDVRCLTEHEGRLIAGGRFRLAMSAPEINVAAWDGVSWEPLGEAIPTAPWTIVNAMTVYNGDLIAAGWFDSVGGVTAKNIARWDGDSWQPLGAGVGTQFPVASVNALIVYRGELIAAGVFSGAGTGGAGNIARWDGEQWHGTGPGLLLGVHFASAMTVFRGELIVAGQESSLVGSEGTTFPPIFPCIWCSGFPIHALAVYKGDLIAAGAIGKSGFGSSSNWIRRWNGAEWVALGAGLPGAAENSWIQTLAVHNNELVAAGVFGTIGPLKNIARWDGQEWRGFGTGLQDSYGVNAVARYNGHLVAAGRLDNPAVTNSWWENWAIWGRPCSQGGPN